MDKKQQVMQVAISLFATLGYERTSIAQICESANVSKGLVFHHFKNKEDLLRQVFVRMEEIINDVGEASNAQNESASAKERLIHLLEAIFLSMANPEQKLFYQFDYQVKCQPAMRLILKDLLDERYTLMMNSFQTILADLPQSNDVVDSHMLIAEIDGIALNYLFSEGDYPLAQIKARFIRKYLMLLDL
ncbi:TetR/AcrR family transcriptional regulator [Enterovibrio baiacu]|uniref:TetR/AcrR family transcriptional regulator n=1 Tax=Enterovibrio baiacu TaxID=2491023 RepID=UPI001013C097|nr:TetR/AcrR family transcriptional regulator [Enterovibrio baiacu]MBE1275320.1 TetR/AcrR family transcriptional regulator [Enterovibrio baiacu]